MEIPDLPITGTCEVSTVGRRTGTERRIEIWYEIVDGRIILTGTPGARGWLANLRENPDAVLHVRNPARDVPVRATEVTDEANRRSIIRAVWDLQPWYAEQPFALQDWVDDSPIVILTPTAAPTPSPTDSKTPRTPPQPH